MKLHRCAYQAYIIILTFQESWSCLAPAAYSDKTFTDFVFEVALQKADAIVRVAACWHKYPPFASHALVISLRDDGGVDVIIDLLNHALCGEPIAFV